MAQSIESSTKSPKNSFDVAVIGAGLTGLCVASGLSQSGLNVALVDAKESPGGNLRALGPLHAGLDFWPMTDGTSELIEFLQVLVGEKIDFTPAEISPLLFENSQCLPFVGFGERSFKTMDELSYYAKSSQWLCPLRAEEIAERLFSRFRGTWMDRKQVTGISTDSHAVTSLVLNGAETLSADKYIFCLSPKVFSKLLPPEMFPARVLQKISKTEIWTSVALHFTHEKPVVDNAEMHFLVGGKDDFEPCVGRFFNSPQPSSTWMTLIESDRIVDTDFVGSVIRNIKKLLKRAYPEALDNVTEKIIIQPHSHGQFQLGSELSPVLDNLWILSPQLSQFSEYFGSLQQARSAILPILTPVASPQAEEFVALLNSSC